MKETGLTGKRRSTTIAATPDDGKSQRKRRRRGFFDPENIDIETNIMFLSPLFAKIWDIDNFASAILKMAATDPTDQNNYHIWILRP